MSINCTRCNEKLENVDALRAHMRNDHGFMVAGTAPSNTVFNGDSAASAASERKRKRDYQPTFIATDGRVLSDDEAETIRVSEF
jgi:hypothetical protein